MRLPAMIILVIVMIFISGCKEPLAPKCYNPPFPSPNMKVKQTLKNVNDPDLDKWINELVVYKEQVEILNPRRVK